MKFESGKIRKNSNKKIKALLEMATHIELVTQTMGLDDCFTMNEPETKSAQDVLDWLADDSNYSDAMISLSCDDDGNPTLMRVEGPYHFCDTFKITFEPVASDSELEEQEVVETEEKAVIRAYSPEYYQWLNDETDPEPEPTGRVVALGDYQSRKDARVERLEAKAEKATAESNARYSAAKSEAQHIPFGQPHLVGHHSYSKTMATAKRIHNNYSKSFEAMDKAEHYQNKAASAESNRAINSDDPEAVKKLKDKLASLERSQELMKAANAIIRKANKNPDTDVVKTLVDKCGISESQAKTILEPDHVGRTGFAQYQLSNNSAEIRRVKKRIEEVSALHASEPLNDSGTFDDGICWTLYEEDGRVKFNFNGIPKQDVRETLSGSGFKFSRYDKTWVRKITSNAIVVAERIAERFKTESVLVLH
ncbi:DUF3560 domain-containing protein [Vibrio parahaemolyticus]|nr:DUF3560 domain-containing protein [Vibrio parahaemolyticus]MDF4668702.1 DUF3560 domain-containing protein [Vibrio parahaemolyticus]HAV1412749.1 DUF3560 domain-containing protein [Vibrio parahaemolyticus]HAV2004832.1 DUF3560 domain-containing protein [Vibrio parahaemolyticus]